ncbi:flavodoxin family protein [Desulfosarcina cetonica]
MIEIAAVFGSPRRKGNTATLLRQAIAGARDAGAAVTEIVLRDLKISPCLEIYGCRETGRCAINDDFRQIEPLLARMHGMILASPIFFYTVSAHAKIFMDRCNSSWVKKYWIDRHPFGGQQAYPRKGLFISVGSTRGQRLFDGALLSMRYFMDALDMQLWNSLLFRKIESEGDILQHPDYLASAYAAGAGLVRALAEDPTSA